MVRRTWGPHARPTASSAACSYAREGPFAVSINPYTLVNPTDGNADGSSSVRVVEVVNVPLFEATIDHLCSTGEGYAAAFREVSINVCGNCGSSRCVGRVFAEMGRNIVDLSVRWGNLKDVDGR